MPFSFQSLAVGSAFAGRYYVIEQLGKGGMGNVYRALDRKVEEEVALKFINPEVAADQKMIERFRNELKYARKIIHKNVCRMYDLSEEGGVPYITMEYIAGEDLHRFIRRSGKLTVEKTIEIAEQVCEGLGEAHKLGAVHRDLKPQNIMIDKQGNARIMDFGIARFPQAQTITEMGKVVGTPKYMSPEQVEGRDIDLRSDLYSLGIILFEMVTGQAPFEGETPLSVVLKQLKAKAPNPRSLNADIPENFSRVILKCLEKEKERRYQSADDLLAELRKVQQEISSKAKHATRRIAGVPRELATRPWLKKAILPVLAVALVVIVFFAVKLSTGSSKAGLAKKKALPEIARLIKEEKYTAAFEMAQNAQKWIPNHPKLVKLWPQVAIKVSIQTTPPGASVYLKDEKAAPGEWKLLGLSPIDNLLMPKSAYKCKIEKDGFKTVEKDIAASDALLNVPLETLAGPSAAPKEAGTLIVDAEPAGSDIYVDGIKKGNSHLELKLETGQHSVNVKKKDYQDQGAQVNINPDKETRRRFTLSLMLPKLATLKKTSDPPGSEVFYGDKETSVNPGEPTQRTIVLTQAKAETYKLTVVTEPTNALITLEEGNNRQTGVSPKSFEVHENQVKIRMEKEDYETVETSLKIETNPFEKDFKLKPLGKGELTIGASPPPTRVEIDGKPIEKPPPPVRSVIVSEGTHLVTFVFDEDVPVEKKVTVQRGQTLPLHLNLEEELRAGTVKVCSYEVSAFPKANLEIDGQDYGFIQRKTKRALAGPHKIRYGFREEGDDPIGVEINDENGTNGNKKIHLTYKVVDFQAAQRIGLTSEDLNQTDKDWLVLKSNAVVGLDLNGSPQGEASSGRDLKVSAAQKGYHVLRLMVKEPGKSCQVEMDMVKISQRKVYRINVVISVL
jgi:serine/threonine protein kinase